MNPLRMLRTRLLRRAVVVALLAAVSWPMAAAGGHHPEDCAESVPQVRTEGHQGHAGPAQDDHADLHGQHAAAVIPEAFEAAGPVLVPATGECGHCDSATCAATPHCSGASAELATAGPASAGVPSGDSEPTAVTRLAHANPASQPPTPPPLDTPIARAR